jgi:hypothetical protein
MRGTALFCVTALIGCEAAPPRDPTGPSLSRLEADAVGNSGPSATGNAHILIFGGTTPEHFQFSAITHADGSVSGEFQLFTDQAGGIRIHGPVTCLGVSGNVARIGGVITESSDPSFAGAPVLWEVVDNGEGANASPDQTSDFIAVGSPGVVAFFCATGFPLQMFDELQGNIQVHS